MKVPGSSSRHQPGDAATRIGSDSVQLATLNWIYLARQ